MPSSLVAAHGTVAPLLEERPQRARLLQAMVEVVAEKGYAAATVADAVERARVSRGTFYEVFDSKHACLEAAHRLGTEVLEAEIDAAVMEAAGDWRQELRLGMRAYLRLLEDDPSFARVHLLEWQALGAQRDAAIRRFARRYGKSLAGSGRPVPPEDELVVLAAGIDQLVCMHLRAGEPIAELEDTLVRCTLRFIAEEETWT